MSLKMNADVGTDTYCLESPPYVTIVPFFLAVWKTSDTTLGQFASRLAYDKHASMLLRPYLKKLAMADEDSPPTELRANLALGSPDASTQN